MDYEKAPLFVMPEHIQTRWASPENMGGRNPINNALKRIDYAFIMTWK